LDPGEGLALVAPPFGTREALYVGVLSLGDGLGQLDRIDSNGFNIYYDATRPENAYLGGEPHALAEGGALIPVPEPGAAALGLVAAIRLLRRRRTGAEPVGP
jgi:hypothetical protein